MEYLDSELSSAEVAFRKLLTARLDPFCSALMMEGTQSEFSPRDLAECEDWEETVGTERRARL